MHAGPPIFQAQNDSYAFGNGAIALHWTVTDRSLCGVCVADRAHGRTLAISAPFVLTFADARTLDAASLRLVA
ncbi:enterotoxin, partial [Paraburkholderia sp. SIMBA_053]